MDIHRPERVSEALREELSEMIAYELSDPRIGEAVVTEVLVSPDMRHAQVRLHLESNPMNERKPFRRWMARAIFCGINLRNGLTFFGSRNFILNPISLPL